MSASQEDVQKKLMAQNKLLEQAIAWTTAYPKNNGESDFDAWNRGLVILKAAAENGSSPGMYYYARALLHYSVLNYLTSTGIRVKEFDTAINYLKRVGTANSKYLLAQYLLKIGRSGNTFDLNDERFKFTEETLKTYEKEGLEYLLSAANDQHLQASFDYAVELCTCLAVQHYEHQILDIEKFYLQAAQLGHPEALTNLSKFYYDKYKDFQKKWRDITSHTDFMLHRNKQILANQYAQEASRWGKKVAETYSSILAQGFFAGNVLLSELNADQTQFNQKILALQSSLAQHQSATQPSTFRSAGPESKEAKETKEVGELQKMQIPQATGETKAKQETQAIAQNPPIVFALSAQQNPGQTQQPMQAAGHNASPGKRKREEAISLLALPGNSESTTNGSFDNAEMSASDSTASPSKRKKDKK